MTLISHAQTASTARHQVDCSAAVEQSEACRRQREQMRALLYHRMRANHPASPGRAILAAT
ncbi:MAG: hypothetical protein V4488_23940 [Pseudomonadota bacterium]